MCSWPRNGLPAGLTRTVLQTALDAEMTEHLGYAKGDEAIEFTGGNHGNGTSPRTVHTDVGEMPIEVPRDRHGVSNPRSCPNTSAESRASMTPLSRCMARG